MPVEKTITPKRPAIVEIYKAEELKRWYWLKQELVDYCKLNGISYTGGKFDILERIAETLDKGISSPKEISKPLSKFNWAKSLLSLDTVITDSYTNDPNTRKFFKQYCGDKFHFSIPFMDWMKNNCGKKLKDAVAEWRKIYDLSKNNNFKSDIPKHNQYNQYIRDFFADNPDKTIVQARHFWKLKRNLPLGKHKYERADLDLR